MAVSEKEATSQYMPRTFRPSAEVCFEINYAVNVSPYMETEVRGFVKSTVTSVLTNSSPLN